MLVGDDGGDRPSEKKRDFPLILSGLFEDVGSRLGLPAIPNHKRRRLRDLILSQAILVGQGDAERWTSYSRRPEHYAARRDHLPPYVSRDAVVELLDALAAAGLIENEIARVGSRGHQSRFRATPDLLAMCQDIPAPVARQPEEIILLRDSDSQPLRYEDTAFTRASRRRLQSVNEQIWSAALSHPLFGLVRPCTPIKIDGNFLGMAGSTLVRIFTGSFNLHGRFYRGWWQGLPKAERARIRINECGVFEADYPRLHITLAYAEAGRLLDGDPYDLGGLWPREMVKRAVNILFNAETEGAATGALNNEFRDLASLGGARALITAVRERHEPVKALFHSGAGLRLMWRDAGIAEQIMLNVEAKGVVVLPVHDSFIVEERHRGHLLEAMDDALGNALRKRSSPCKKIGNRNSFPHMEEKGEEARAEVEVGGSQVPVGEPGAGDRPSSHTDSWAGPSLVPALDKASSAKAEVTEASVGETWLVFSKGGTSRTGPAPSPACLVVLQTSILKRWSKGPMPPQVARIVSCILGSDNGRLCSLDAGGLDTRSLQNSSVKTSAAKFIAQVRNLLYSRADTVRGYPDAPLAG